MPSREEFKGLKDDVRLEREKNRALQAKLRDLRVEQRGGRSSNSVGAVCVGDDTGTWHEKETQTSGIDIPSEAMVDQANANMLEAMKEVVTSATMTSPTRHRARPPRHTVNNKKRRCQITNNTMY